MRKLKGDLLNAWNAVGGLSEPSKMPCYSYSISATKCKIGSKLRNIKNSVCNKCYALKGFYVFSNVKHAQEPRFLSLNDPNWVANMTLLIGSLEHTGFFRWHDSGDLQSIEHLDKICQIARNLPNIKFWLPTKEYEIISAYVNKNSIPENLTIRLSAYMVDGPLPIALAKKLNVTCSGFSSNDNFTCPASKQDNMCLNCRLCWNKNVQSVIYKKH